MGIVVDLHFCGKPDFYQLPVWMGKQDLECRVGNRKIFSILLSLSLRICRRLFYSAINKAECAQIVVAIRDRYTSCSCNFRAEGFILRAPDIVQQILQLAQ